MYVNSLRQKVASLPRTIKKALFVAFDFFALILLVWFSYTLRLNHLFVPDLGQALLMLAAPAVSLPVFVRMGLYRSVLRYLPDRAIWTIFRAVTIAALMWVAIAFLTRTTGAAAVPRSVPIIYWLLSFTVIACSRFGAKHLLIESATATRQALTLIYGTGSAALQLASALKATSERRLAGFVSEDPGLHGMDLQGLRVHAADDLEKVVANLGVQEIVITTPSSNGRVHRDLVARLAASPVRLRILPAITDLAAGKYSIGDVRDIDIDDLLRRSPVPADPKLMRSVIEGRVILITGAAGSIGSALCRTVARLNPARLVLMDFNEYGLFALGREVERLASCPVKLVLGSVADAALSRRVLAEHGVQTVYHCAAFKHVAMVEENLVEGVRNNVFGTRAIAQAASDCGVDNFVLISSDKAVHPTSAMGATKRWSELIVRHYGMNAGVGDNRRTFASVRFGNVIGSSGSVVPLFKEQIAAGGPVTLTDERMTRYFMSVREASELIVQASALAGAGDVLLLDMGDPVRIRDLAEDMIILAGLTVRDERNPSGDIEIVRIGAREGEKLHEQLAYHMDGLSPTAHPKILRARRPSRVNTRVPAMLDELEETIARRDETALRRVLFELVA